MLRACSASGTSTGRRARAPRSFRPKNQPMRAACVVSKASLSKADIMTNEELPLKRGFARGNKRAMLLRIGVLLLSAFARSDRSTEMALSDHPRSLAGNCENGHDLSSSPADERRDVGR